MIGICKDIFKAIHEGFASRAVHIDQYSHFKFAFLFYMVTILSRKRAFYSIGILSTCNNNNMSI